MKGMWVYIYLMMPICHTHTHHTHTHAHSSTAHSSTPRTHRPPFFTVGGKDNVLIDKLMGDCDLT